MQECSVTKERAARFLNFFHYCLTILLFLVVFFLTLGDRISDALFDKRTLYFKQELLKNVWLYETEQLFNFMADDQYRYYIGAEIKGDPVPVLKKWTPFLVGTSCQADISLEKEKNGGKDWHLSFKYSGQILRFYNREYPFGGESSLWIDLQSQGVDARYGGCPSKVLDTKESEKTISISAEGSYAEISTKQPESVVRIKK